MEASISRRAHPAHRIEMSDVTTAASLNAILARPRGRSGTNKNRPKTQILEWRGAIGRRFGSRKPRARSPIGCSLSPRSRVYRWTPAWIPAHCVPPRSPRKVASSATWPESGIRSRGLGLEQNATYRPNDEHLDHPLPVGGGHHPLAGRGGDCSRALLVPGRPRPPLAAAAPKGARGARPARPCRSDTPARAGAVRAELRRAPRADEVAYHLGRAVRQY